MGIPERLGTLDVDCESLFVSPNDKLTNILLALCYFLRMNATCLSQRKFFVSGPADTAMKLWEVATGCCLYAWEFLTAVKWVVFSEDDTQISCFTEQRLWNQENAVLSSASLQPFKNCSAHGCSLARFE